MILSSVYYPGPAGGRLPLVILHGLFGAGINWKSMAVRLSGHLPVYTFDLRNHGESPHHPLLSYPLMAGDVAETCGALGIERALFLGHSMGGKCVMQLALDRPELCAAIISADIGPARNPARLGGILNALLALDLSKVESRGDADRMLSGPIPDRRVRSFLLQNLRRNPEAEAGTGNAYRWRIHLSAIAEQSDNVWGPVEDEGRSSSLPVLFIAGSESGYLDDGQRAAAAALFPSARFSVLEGAGHWVHVDRPEEFFRETLSFLGPLDSSG